MDNLSLAKEWINHAEKDLGSARFLINMHPKPLEIICFHCQQCAEKLLKGFLVLKGAEIIKTHDLLFLVKKCCEYEKEFSKIEKQCIRLTDFGTNIRYPSSLEITEADVTLALKDITDINGFILQRIR
jgi:HEPN domain-containing protein